MTSDPGVEPKGYELLWAKAVKVAVNSSQHTPVIPASCRSSCRVELVVEIEDQGPELAKLGALERLGEEVTDRVLGGTIFYRNLLLLDAVGDEEAAHVNVLRPLRAGELAVPLHQNGTLIILEDDVLGNLAPLSFQET